MDRVLSFYPVEQESIFLFNENGLRTRQGCLDLDRWFQEYEIKINANLYKKFSLFYNLKSMDDYYRYYLRHTFYIRYCFNDISIQAGISPNFMKKEDRLFLGLLKKEKDFMLEIDFGMKDFVHNYVLSKKRESTRDPYNIFPFFIYFNFKKIFNGYINFEFDKTFMSKKEVIINDTFLGYEYSKDFEGNISFLIPIYRNFYLGFKGEYWYKNKDYLGDKTFLKQAISNIFIRTGDRLKIEPSFSIEYFEEKDSVLFNRIDYISGLNITKILNNYFFITLGFQDSRKKMEKDNEIKNNFEQRLVLALTINFSKNTSFYIFEGIELDHFSNVFEKINYLHNHTFLTLTHRF